MRNDSLERRRPLPLARSAIKQSFTQPRVGNDLRPLREPQVRGQHHCGLLGALGDNLKQELGADLCQGYVSDLIDGY